MLSLSSPEILDALVLACFDHVASKNCLSPPSNAAINETYKNQHGGLKWSAVPNA